MEKVEISSNEPTLYSFHSNQQDFTARAVKSTKFVVTVAKTLATIWLRIPVAKESALRDAIARRDSLWTPTKSAFQSHGVPAFI